ncbi:MAG TPA: capsule assembly Wzi family protein [Bacteroidota bacterium]|nr:capsule assembly Wzi family protein [Bacteroidota bacterium]
MIDTLSKIRWRTRAARVPGMLIAGLLIFPFLLLSQTLVNYVPVHHPVYDYLERLAVESAVDWDGTVQPASRFDVARALLQADAHKNRLTGVEQADLLYFEVEFRPELTALGLTSADSSSRWHLFSYHDSRFGVDLDPVLGVTASDGDTHLFNGAKFEGTAGSDIAYGFHFNDNTEKGPSIDWQKLSVPETGINIVKSSGGNEIEYSEVRTYLSYGSNTVQLAAGKDFVEWGSGERGKLILSDKAPSFPIIRFDYRPVSWLTFHYLHGWLQSLVIDSSRSYATDLPEEPRNVYREKYIAAHMLSVRPCAGLQVSLGESIIYSDGPPNILFLIPIMFFRAADHYLTHYSQNDGNNSQFFLDTRYDVLSHVRAYGTLFIDEIVPSEIFNPSQARNQLGFTLGTRVVNPIVSNVDMSLEYTRILPWVYSNSNPAQTYESDGYPLGDYIGQNADQLYAAVQWRPAGRFELSLYYDYVRRGGMTDVERQYELPSLPFLYGNIERASLKGFAIRYEYLHDLTLVSDFHWQNPYLNGGHYNLALTLEYGLDPR